MLYLAYFEARAPDDAEFAEQHFELRPGLVLVESAQTRSRLYHALKRRLPPDTPLLVAPLSDDPKFKGLAQGALTWLRNRARTDDLA